MAEMRAILSLCGFTKEDVVPVPPPHYRRVRLFKPLPPLVADYLARSDDKAAAIDLEFVFQGVIHGVAHYRLEG